MKKIIYQLLVFTFLINSSLFANDAKPFQISLVNPAQLYDEQTEIAGLRLNLVYGVNETVSFLDIGLVNEVNGDLKNAIQTGLVNITHQNTDGYQTSLANFTGGNLSGWQASATFNIADGNTSGLQVSPAYNYAGSLCGMQLSAVNITSQNSIGYQGGLVNIAYADFSGIQDAAFVNYTSGNFKGIQSACIYNYAYSVTGLQIGLVNITKDLNGIQIGLFNINGNDRPCEFLPFINFSF